MTDRAARVRTGTVPRRPQSGLDPRISVDLAHLRGLEGGARALTFLPRQPARSVLNGRHASRLRGRGLNFEELRGYLPGDDIRTIDWKVTARTGSPHVRVYTEERDRPAVIMVDQRMSMFYGTRHAMKSVIAAEAAALAAFRVHAQGDRVGGIVFGDNAIAEIRPERSRRGLDRFLAALAEANALLHAHAPATAAMGLNRPLEAVARTARRDHLVIVLSDFDGMDETTERHLAGMAQHNDVLLAPVLDPIVDDLPKGLRFSASDGVLQAEIDTRHGAVREAVAASLGARLGRITEWGRRYGMPLLPLSSGEDTMAQMLRLFGLRTRA